MTEPATVPTNTATRPGWRRGLVLVMALVAVLVIEVVATVALRSPARAHPVASVLALPGVGAMARGAQVDPSELSHVAASPAVAHPLGFAALATLDALLLLVVATAVGSGQLARRVRPWAFLGSLAVLLVAMVMVVGAVRRLRFLAALYLSPPFGTLTYLLRYGTFDRAPALAVLSVVMAAKLVALWPLAGTTLPSTTSRAAVGLVLSSLAATVLVVMGDGLPAQTVAPLTDAAAAAVVGLAVIGWAGALVSAGVRRLH